MLSYCLVCRKNTENKDSKIVKSKNNRLMLSSKCTTCKKSKFIKEKEARGLLSNLGMKTPLSKVPLLTVLFGMQFHLSIERTK